jgi:hypothetical protein
MWKNKTILGITRHSFTNHLVLTGQGNLGEYCLLNYSGNLGANKCIQNIRKHRLGKRLLEDRKKKRKTDVVTLFHVAREVNIFTGI